MSVKHASFFSLAYPSMSETCLSRLSSRPLYVCETCLFLLSSRPLCLCLSVSLADMSVKHASFVSLAYPSMSETCLSRLSSRPLYVCETCLFLLSSRYVCETCLFRLSSRPLYVCETCLFRLSSRPLYVCNMPLCLSSRPLSVKHASFVSLFRLSL